MDPFADKGGPVKDLESIKSAEWKEEYDDSDESEIKTEQIAEFFPEKYATLMSWDSLNRVAMKQMMKVEIKKTLYNMESEMISCEENEFSEWIEAEGGKNWELVGNEMIKVFNDLSEERKELSITTPRSKLMSSNDNYLRQIGDKTILQHTFEDFDSSQYSIGSQNANKDSGNKKEENRSFPENYTNSNNSNEK